MPAFLLAVGFILLAILYRLFNSPAWTDQLGDLATSIVRPVILPIVGVLNAPAFVFVMSATILLSAVVVCVVYHARRHKPALISLQAFHTDMEAARTGDLRNADWDVVRDRVTEITAKHGVLMSAWGAFLTDMQAAGRIPHRPFAAYVAEDPTEKEPEHGGLMQALPGYYVSFGLILTFLGLVVALYFAARGFRSGNIAEAKMAIIQLLNAASFKFLSSVAALISAMIISLFARYTNGRLAVVRHRAVGSVETLLGAARQRWSGDGLSTKPVLERLDRLIAAFERPGR